MFGFWLESTAVALCMASLACKKCTASLFVSVLGSFLSFECNFFAALSSILALSDQWVQAEILVCSNLLPPWEHHPMCTSQFSPNTGVQLCMCTVYTNPTLWHSAPSSAMCTQSSFWPRCFIANTPLKWKPEKSYSIAMLKAILQNTTHLYSKIPNNSHHDAELQVWLSGWSHFARKAIDGCNQHFRIDPIPGSVFPLQTPIVAT